VIPKICNLCEQQRTEKLSSFYWAWVGPAGRREAYKQLLCRDCVMEHFAPLILHSEDPLLVCPDCGIGTVDDYEAVYLTYCIPGMAKAQSEMPLCGACATKLRAKALENSRRLADREASIGGPQSDAPEPTLADQWAKLGLHPRG